MTRTQRWICNKINNLASFLRMCLSETAIFAEKWWQQRIRFLLIVCLCLEQWHPHCGFCTINANVHTVKEKNKADVFVLL